MLEGMRSQEKNEETTILDTTADFTKSLTFAHKSVRIFHTCLYASKMSLGRYGEEGSSTWWFLHICLGEFLTLYTNAKEFQCHHIDYSASKCIRFAFTDLFVFASYQHLFGIVSTATTFYSFEEGSLEIA